MAIKKKITQELGVNDQTPREIVAELDKFIVGQDEAKKSVAIALRNRWRSHKLPDDMRDDVIPKNILMIGSTGVGKTEIARRLARLVKAPFIKVEATKFTEVGYVGRDVESIIRDLAQTAVRMVRKQRTDEVKEKAAANALERLLDVLVPEPKRSQNPLGKLFGNAEVDVTPVEEEENPKIVNIPEWFTTSFKVYDNGGKDKGTQSYPSEPHIITLILNAPEGKVFSVQGVLDIGTWYDETNWLKVYDGTGTDNEIHYVVNRSYEIDPFITSVNSIRFDLHKYEDDHYAEDDYDGEDSWWPDSEGVDLEDDYDEDPDDNPWEMDPMDITRICTCKSCKESFRLNPKGCKKFYCLFCGKEI